MNPGPLHWEHGVLPTGPPEKSQKCLFKNTLKDASKRKKTLAMDVKIPASYFVDGNKLIVKFIWRDTRPRVANATLKKVRRHYLTSRLIIKL